MFYLKNQREFLRVCKQVKHGLFCGRVLNYARTMCIKKRLIATKNFRKPMVCIVGSGPAGFYTAQYLLKVINCKCYVYMYSKQSISVWSCRLRV